MDKDSLFEDTNQFVMIARKGKMEAFSHLSEITYQHLKYSDQKETQSLWE